MRPLPEIAQALYAAAEHADQEAKILGDVTAGEMLALATFAAPATFELQWKTIGKGDHSLVIDWGALVAWLDKSELEGDIYGIRFQPSGATAWFCWTPPDP